MKLHHIGIVVKNIQESLGEITKYLNFEETSIPIEVQSQRVNVCFLKTSDVYIELIEPIDNNSPVKAFSESGGGFHHLCFEVDNIFEEVEKMRKNGARVIVAPTKGFEDRLIAFVLSNMKNTNCNLIEFAERK
jgi:methylmalonyl-CoA/ethylmalonyl-CoA epimerase